MTRKPNSRWTGFALLVGGCAIAVSAGAGLGPDVHNAPEARHTAHVFPIHTKPPRPHTHPGSIRLNLYRIDQQLRKLGL